MADITLGRETLPVIAGPRGASSLPAVVSILSRYERPQIEAFLAVAIDLLDVIDGDPDFEETDAEDAFVLSLNALQSANGPGCPISDPDMAVDDERCDDLNDDREEEAPLIPRYGIDQTKCLDQYVGATDRSLMRPHVERIRRTRCDRIEYRGWNGGGGHIEYRLRPAGQPAPKA